jgi:hypothetical protein
MGKLDSTCAAPPGVHDHVSFGLLLQLLTVVQTQEYDLLPEKRGGVGEELKVEAERQLIRLADHDPRRVVAVQVDQCESKII